MSLTYKIAAGIVRLLGVKKYSKNPRKISWNMLRNKMQGLLLILTRR